MKQLKRSCIRQHLDVARHTRSPWPRLLSNCPSPQPSLIRVSASGRSFDRTISEFVSGSSWIAHRARGPPAPTIVAELSSSDGPRSRALALTDLLHHPHIHTYWHKVLHHPHIHSAKMQCSTATLCYKDEFHSTFLYSPILIVLHCLAT